MLASRLIQTTKDIINKKVLKIGEDGKFQTNIIADPVVDSHFVAFILDGAYTEMKHAVVDPEGKSDDGDYIYDNGSQPNFAMPLILSNDTIKVQSQQFISEGMLNKALATLQENGKLSLQEEVSSTFLTQLFDNFDSVFGKNKTITIQLDTIEAPKFNIQKDADAVQTLNAEL